MFPTLIVKKVSMQLGETTSDTTGPYYSVVNNGSIHNGLVDKIPGRLEETSGKSISVEEQATQLRR